MPRKNKQKKRLTRPVRLKENHEQEKRRLHIVLEFGWALLLFVLLVLAKEHFVDHSIVGEHIKQSAYDISQVWLAAVRDTRQLPIVVVDIGTLQPCPQRLPDGTVLYPRQALKDAVTAVMNQEPAAVAIDVDFSFGKDIRCPAMDAEELARDQELASDQQQFSDRGGPPFFDFCLDQKRPIFLGVYRTQYDSPDGVDTLLRGILAQPTKKGELLLDAFFYVPINDVRTDRQHSGPGFNLYHSC